MAQSLTMSEREARARHRKRALAVLLVLGLIGGLALLVWFKLFREVPTHFDDPADEFKFGSIGNEAYDGIPYWIWLVLPRAFPEHLPGNGGYASFGMVWEEGARRTASSARRARCRSGSRRRPSACPASR